LIITTLVKDPAREDVIVIIKGGGFSSGLSKNEILMAGGGWGIGVRLEGAHGGYCKGAGNGEEMVALKGYS